MPSHLDGIYLGKLFFSFEIKPINGYLITVLLFFLQITADMKKWITTRKKNIIWFMTQIYFTTFFSLIFEKNVSLLLLVITISLFYIDVIKVLYGVPYDNSFFIIIDIFLRSRRWMTTYIQWRHPEKYSQLPHRELRGR